MKMNGLVRISDAWAVRAVSRDGAPWFVGIYWFTTTPIPPECLDGQRIALFSSRRAARLAAKKVRDAKGDRSVAAVRVRVTIQTRQERP